MKQISALLLAILILFSLAACQKTNSPALRPSADHPFGEGNGEFVAKTLMGNGYFDEEPSLSFKIDDGAVYIDNVLYDKISYVDDFRIHYSDFFQAGESAPSDTYEILQKIKSTKSCFVLKTTKSEAYYAKDIAVYYIDGVYYFVDSFDSGEVAWVYFANLS